MASPAIHLLAVLGICTALAATVTSANRIDPAKAARPQSTSAKQSHEASSAITPDGSAQPRNVSLETLLQGLGR